jgi:hypothetical protein
METGKIDPTPEKKNNISFVFLPLGETESLGVWQRVGPLEHPRMTDERV